MIIIPKSQKRKTIPLSQTASMIQQGKRHL
jgi:hypothetical protein